MSDVNQVEKTIEETVPPWKPNQAQVISIVSSVIKGLGWILAFMGVHIAPDVQATFFGPEALMFYTGAAMALAPMVHDWYIHSRNGKLRAVENMPSVAKIVIRQDNVPPDVQKIADDGDRGKVVQLKQAA